jgi:hypothetical protein
MKSIKEKAKKWCSEHSNKGCTEQCDGCWQLKQAWGCEQHNMETAYGAGANYVLKCIEEATNICFDEELKNVIRQLKK